MPPDALETLRQVNGNLRSALIRLRPERMHCSTIKAQDFSDILSQLRRAAECLRRLPSHSEAATALEQESLEYRSNLEKLRHFLPDVQGRLLAEKSRLETARNHLAAAASWDRASKKTF
ncbi:MAG TPA: hypothetical protein VJW96_02345 [Terriglobales bacterium]|nr:hypothetical protein [Terriglobales bacterium]